MAHQRGPDEAKEPSLEQELGRLKALADIFIDNAIIHPIKLANKKMQEGQAKRDLELKLKSLALESEESEKRFVMTKVDELLDGEGKTNTRPIVVENIRRLLELRSRIKRIEDLQKKFKGQSSPATNQDALDLAKALAVDNTQLQLLLDKYKLAKKHSPEKEIIGFEIHDLVNRIGPFKPDDLLIYLQTFLTRRQIIFLKDAKRLIPRFGFPADLSQVVTGLLEEMEGRETDSKRVPKEINNIAWWESPKELRDLFHPFFNAMQGEAYIKDQEKRAKLKCLMRVVQKIEELKAKLKILKTMRDPNETINLFERRQVASANINYNFDDYSDRLLEWVDQIIKHVDQLIAQKPKNASAESPSLSAALAVAVDQTGPKTEPLPIRQPNSAERAPVSSVQAEPQVSRTEASPVMGIRPSSSGNSPVVEAKISPPGTSYNQTKVIHLTKRIGNASEQLVKTFQSVDEARTFVNDLILDDCKHDRVVKYYIKAEIFGQSKPKLLLEVASKKIKKEFSRADGDLQFQRTDTPVVLRKKKTGKKRGVLRKITTKEKTAQAHTNTQQSKTPELMDRSNHSMPVIGGETLFSGGDFKREPFKKKSNLSFLLANTSVGPMQPAQTPPIEEKKLALDLDPHQSGAQIQRSSHSPQGSSQGDVKRQVSGGKSPKYYELPKPRQIVTGDVPISTNRPKPTIKIKEDAKIADVKKETIPDRADPVSSNSSKEPAQPIKFTDVPVSDQVTMVSRLDDYVISAAKKDRKEETKRVRTRDAKNKDSKNNDAKEGLPKCFTDIIDPLRDLQKQLSDAHTSLEQAWTNPSEKLLAGKLQQRVMSLTHALVEVSEAFTFVARLPFSENKSTSTFDEKFLEDAFKSVRNQLEKLGDAFKSLEEVLPSIRMFQDKASAFKNKLAELTNSFDSLQKDLKKPTLECQNRLRDLRIRLNNLARDFADLEQDLLPTKISTKLFQARVRAKAELKNKDPSRIIAGRALQHKNWSALLQADIRNLENKYPSDKKKLEAFNLELLNALREAAAAACREFFKPAVVDPAASVMRTVFDFLIDLSHPNPVTNPSTANVKPKHAVQLLNSIQDRLLHQEQAVAVDPAPEEKDRLTKKAEKLALEVIRESLKKSLSPLEANKKLVKQTIAPNKEKPYITYVRFEVSPEQQGYIARVAAYADEKTRLSLSDELRNHIPVANRLVQESMALQDILEHEAKKLEKEYDNEFHSITRELSEFERTAAKLDDLYKEREIKSGELRKMYSAEMRRNVNTVPDFRGPLKKLKNRLDLNFDVEKENAKLQNRFCYAKQKHKKNIRLIRKYLIRSNKEFIDNIKQLLCLLDNMVSDDNMKNFWKYQATTYLGLFKCCPVEIGKDKIPVPHLAGGIRKLLKEDTVLQKLRMEKSSVDAIKSLPDLDVLRLYKKVQDKVKERLEAGKSFFHGHREGTTSLVLDKLDGIVGMSLNESSPQKFKEAVNGLGAIMGMTDGTHTLRAGAAPAA